VYGPVPCEPGWWIVAKIALFIAIPVPLVYLVKFVAGCDLRADSI
jgi:hypothetical protein